MQLYKSSSNALCLPSFLEMPQNPHVTLTFDKVYNPLRLPRKTTLQRPKVARACGALCILTWECASRHNGVHFFDISTSKIAPEAEVVLYILTSKCASRHNGVHIFDINFQKCCETEVFLNFFTCKFASRHNGVHFFRHLNFQKWLGTRQLFYAFDFEMCFAPQRRAIFHLSSGQLAPHPPL